VKDPDGTVWWKANRHNGNQDWKCPPGGLFFDPLPSYADVEGGLEITPEDYNPPLDLPEERLRALEESARWLFENTDFALLCAPCTTHLELLIGGREAWWVRIATDPSGVNEFLAKAVESALAQLRLLDQAVGKYALMHQIPDDMADLHGVSIGVESWREIYKPHYKRLFGEWHRTTSMRVLLHSCGAISEILDDLIECGVDVINPVQVSARGMDPGDLKARFGDRIVFYGGGLDPVLTPSETPAEEVYRSVRQHIMDLGSGGGYIFSGQHNLPGDTPVAHLEAMLQAYMDTRTECLCSTRGKEAADA
jgi:uroporphyrinogen decarboxylase